MVIAECAEGSKCIGSETVLLRNTIFVGNPEFDGGGDTTCLAWSDFPHDPFVYDHDMILDLKAMPDPCPVHSLCNLDPGLSNASLDAFDGHLLSNSKAVDAGTSDGAPKNDFDGLPRDARPDIGASEWRP